jgi:hypothetical protein
MGGTNQFFEAAYWQVLESNFKFQIDYPAKLSRDKKRSAKLIIEKTETVTSVYVNINNGGSSITQKLFDKKNAWRYDCVYILARHNKWFNKNRFGISCGNGKIEVSYSVEKNEVQLYENGNRVTEIDFSKYFRFN